MSDGQRSAGEKLKNNTVVFLSDRLKEKWGRG
jgi:hypothetical protein